MAIAACPVAMGAAVVPSNWFYRAWQTEDGLPDNTVSGIAQSPDGYLWVATKGGIMRFNGGDFAPLPLRTLPDLPSRAVRAMFLDRRGRLWLGMERGPLIRIGEKSFHAFTKEEGILPQRVVSMTDDADGRLWVGFSGGLCLIEDDRVTRFGNSRGIPRGDQSSLACDSGGQVWLANGGKLGRLGSQGFDLVREFGSSTLRIAAAIDSGLWITVNSDLLHAAPEEDPVKLASLPAGSSVNVIFEGRRGAVWIGTVANGLFRFKDGALERVPTSQVGVNCITEDREGNIWAGTNGGGLNLVRPRTAELIGKSKGLPFASVQSLACDASGRILAVGQNGALTGSDSNGWTPFLDPDGTSPKMINCVAVDPEGRIWLGTRNRGLLQIDGNKQQHFRAQDGLASSFVRSLFAASNGDLLITTGSPSHIHRLRGGKISLLDHPGNFSAVRAMAEGLDGTIWAGTSDGKILRVEGDALVEESAIDEPFPLSVRTLHTTSDGSLWIGYAGDGLGHLKNGRYSRITTANGLHDDYISQILDDGEGALWLAANRGLFQVDLEELLAVSNGASKRLRSRVFGRNDGLSSLQPNRDYSPKACRGTDHRLYFSMSNGILEVRPDKIRENPFLPPVILEQVSLDDHLVAQYQSRSMLSSERTADQTDLSRPNPLLHIAPGHDKLVIDFAALSLASPENVHFRYRLKPFDKNWVEARNRPSATYPRLPAGKYDFRVVACNNAGLWNEEGTSLRIVVQPFFWETWWFKIGGGVCTALAAGGLVFLGQRRKHRLQLRRIAANRALEQERSRIARDIHDDLGASLTHITLLSQSTPLPPDESADEVLDQIHATARHLMRSMEEVVWAVNPEHDTFDALANYLSNYGQGFLGVAGVRCRLEMPMALPEHPLSAQIRHNLFLAFKEALNNAVKYAQASEVRISLQPGVNQFLLRIEDDGKGIDPDAPIDPMRPTAGSGLANMRGRMEEVGGSCTVSSTMGQGTTVEFEVPFKANP